MKHKQQAITQIATLCDALPDGDLKTTHELAARMEYAAARKMRGYMLDPALDDYAVEGMQEGRYQRMWGNKKTVAVVREALK